MASSKKPGNTDTLRFLWMSELFDITEAQTLIFPQEETKAEKT